MATKILFAPKQSDAVLAIARSLTPAGFELLIADIGTPEFYAAAAQAEYYLGLARQMGGEFFRSAPNMKLVQLLSAGYDRVDVEAARKAKVPVSNNGGANAIAVAEHTIMLILAVLKRVVKFHNDVVAVAKRALKSTMKALTLGRDSAPLLYLPCCCAKGKYVEERRSLLVLLTDVPKCLFHSRYPLLWRNCWS